MTVIEALAVGIPVGAIVLFIVNRAQERASISNRAKALKIFKKHEISDNLELLLDEIVTQNYYGTMNSVVRKREREFDLHTYSFSFSGTPVSITEYLDHLRSQQMVKVSIKINHNLFLVAKFRRTQKGDFFELEEYHHDWVSLVRLEKIFSDVRQNRMNRALEWKRFLDSENEKNFTFKRK